MIDNNEVWSIEEKCNPLNPQIRDTQIKILERIIESLRERNAVEMDVFPGVKPSYRRHLPSIIFFELFKEPAEDNLTARALCFRDRQVYIEFYKAIEGWDENGQE